MAVRSIGIAALILVLLLAGIACTSTVNPASVSLGQTVTLAIGEKVSITGESLAISFDKVVTDSRCPTGVECFWAGEVSCLVDITLQGDTESLILTEPGATSSPVTRDFNPYRIAFSVSPYPQAGKEIPSKDYRLQITITRVMSVFIPGISSALPVYWQMLAAITRTKP
jgi:hypothetical protein